MVGVGMSVWVVQWRTSDGKDHVGDFETKRAAQVYYELLKLCGAEPTDIWPIDPEAPDA